MSKVEFKDYDDAYDKTNNIYNLIQNTGMDILINLKKLCDSLKEKWHGEDAPTYINTLIAVSNSLEDFFRSSVSMVVEMSDRVISVQKTVFAISHHNIVGQKLKDDFAGKESIEEAISKKSYKLESLKDEYDLLDNIISDYMKLKNSYVLNIEGFFDNWVDDPKKKDAEASVESLLNRLDKYLGDMEVTRQALGKVVVNTEQVLEDRK